LATKKTFILRTEYLVEKEKLETGCFFCGTGFKYYHLGVQINQSHLFTFSHFLPLFLSISLYLSLSLSISLSISLSFFLG